MARSINSPGVQITETDLTDNTQLVGGTSVYVAGYAPQGPTDEVVAITTISDLETTYGVPQTPAERYFYYSCKEILNSPATLLTTRLPYGSGSGTGFDNKFGALFFPVQTVTDPASGALGYKILQPKQIAITEENYAKILQNNYSWNNTLTSTSVGFDGTTMTGGIIVINSAQTTINENFEGYYVGIADNSDFGPGTNFTSVSKFYSLTGADSFGDITSTRLGFDLSGSASSAGTGSISEIIEGVPTFNFGDQYYKDSIILTLFKVRSSIYEPQQLVASLAEAHIGSLDSTKKTLADSGGTKRSFYIEDVVKQFSNNLKVLVHPAISRQTSWASLTANQPEKAVTVDTSGKALFGAGTYQAIYNTDTKKVGSVLTKLQRALTLIESTETVNVDILVDAGLSTIFANTAAELSAGDVYDDTRFTTQTSGSVKDRWLQVFSTFNSFAQNTRKDCVFISDPLRQVFVYGEDSKVLSLKNKTFTLDVYNPIKELYAGANSNYSIAYGNWVKVYDAFSDKGTWLPFSGYAAAVFARTDLNAQSWIAPAGLNRGVVSGIIDIGLNPNQKQRDFLYTIAINPVVFFQNDGYVIFGQKTLQTKPSAFDRINVRRLFLTLEKAVGRSLRYFVFEPNTAFTRTRLVNSISPVFDLAKNTDGLFDYLIVCDERNNPTSVIDNNELNVDIYIKPVRAAEFILVNFIATRTGQNFQELI
jgi:hypothetical protein